jgi:hypothetical protein
LETISSRRRWEFSGSPERSFIRVRVVVASTITPGTRNS